MFSEIRKQLTNADKDYGGFEKQKQKKPRRTQLQNKKTTK